MVKHCLACKSAKFQLVKSIERRMIAGLRRDFVGAAKVNGQEAHWQQKTQR
jgi:hypothetical protein